MSLWKTDAPSVAVVGTMSDRSDVQCENAHLPISVVSEGTEQKRSKGHCSKAQLPISGSRP